MRADYETYRNAAGVSIKGLFFQLLVAGITAAYAFWSGDHAAMSGAIFMGVGVVAWLTLAIVYDQHRRERIEAMENDALATTSGAGGSVFEARQDFRPAAARLAGLYRWFFPLVTIGVVLTLVTVGLWRLWDAREAMAGTSRVILPGTRHAGWTLGLGITFAALGFVVARYAAGLAKQAVWANLRAGAAFAVGASLIWLTLAVAQLVKYLGTDAVVRVLPTVVPAFMVVIGVEVLFQFLLTIYRPRRAGEIPRAAFESRLLGLAAAPDRIAQSISEAISYQLGFDVTGGWAYRLLSRSIAPLVIFGVVITWLMSGVVVVQPHQRAMVLRFGKPIHTDLGPGWHFKAPWPIDSVYVPEYFTRDDKGRLRVRDHTVTGLRRVELGTPPPGTAEPILWTNDHVGEEVWQYVRISDTGSTGGLTDIAAVSVGLPMEYTISDVLAFDLLGPPERRDDLIRTTARREVTRFFQGLTLDEILGGDRVALAARLRTAIQDALAQLNPDATGKPRGAGVNIVSVGLTGVHPPKETAAAFETPVQAAQRREAKIASAETDALRALIGVVGDATLARSIVAEINARNEIESRANREERARALADQDVKIQQLLLSAGGSSAAMLADARGNRWNEHMAMRGRAAEFRGKLMMHEAMPDLYRLNHQLSAVREAMRTSRVFIVPDDIAQLNPILDLKDVNLGVDIFQSNAETPK